MKTLHNFFLDRKSIPIVCNDYLVVFYHHLLNKIENVISCLIIKPKRRNLLLQFYNP
jgi:hypothetical protein